MTGPPSEWATAEAVERIRERGRLGQESHRQREAERAGKASACLRSVNIPGQSPNPNTPNGQGRYDGPKEDRRMTAQTTTDTIDIDCEVCGRSFTWGGKGMRPTACSSTCRAARHRAQKRQEANGNGATHGEPEPDQVEPATALDVRSLSDAELAALIPSSVRAEVQRRYPKSPEQRIVDEARRHGVDPGVALVAAMADRAEAPTHHYRDWVESTHRRQAEHEAKYGAEDYRREFTRELSKLAHELPAGSEFDTFAATARPYLGRPELTGTDGEAMLRQVWTEANGDST